MFQFPPFASCNRMMTGLQPAGLSHSEIRGSTVICTYPQLIAAYHVLHRLCEPRHPPCALSYFLHQACTQKAHAGSSYFQLYSKLILDNMKLSRFESSLYSLACVNMSKIFVSVHSS